MQYCEKCNKFVDFLTDVETADLGINWRSHRHVCPACYLKYKKVRMIADVIDNAPLRLGLVNPRALAESMMSCKG